MAVADCLILIHTSVKLVTNHLIAEKIPCVILIHTSVKLVTWLSRIEQAMNWHFNPHEREARDGCRLRSLIFSPYFNPHEREARDVRIGNTITVKVEF